MCARFTQQLPVEEICDLYSLRGTALPPNRRTHYNGAPGQDFAACRLDEDGARAIAPLCWGLVPSWARDAKVASRLINTRSETVHNKPSFRSTVAIRLLLRQHRRNLTAVPIAGRDPLEEPDPLALLRQCG